MNISKADFYRFTCTALSSVAVFSSHASIDSNESKTSTQVTSSQIMSEKSKDTSASRDIKLNQGILTSCMSCSNNSGI